MVYVLGRSPESLGTLVSYTLENLIRKASDQNKDPSCQELSALTPDQVGKAGEILDYVAGIPAMAITEILERVIEYPTEESGETTRKVIPKHLNEPMLTEQIISKKKEFVH